jgi:hypothetical protein
MKWQKVIYYTDNWHAYDLHHKIAPSEFRRKQLISVHFWKQAIFSYLLFPSTYLDLCIVKLKEFTITLLAS